MQKYSVVLFKVVLIVDQCVLNHELLIYSHTLISNLKKSNGLGTDTDTCMSQTDEKI
jgi:hypothetical protein